MGFMTDKGIEILCTHSVQFICMPVSDLINLILNQGNIIHRLICICLCPCNLFYLT